MVTFYNFKELEDTQVVVECNSNELQPDISIGDMLLVDRKYKKETGGVYVFYFDNKILIRKVRVLPNKRFLLMSNTTEDILIESSNFHLYIWVGRIVKVCKSLMNV